MSVEALLEKIDGILEEGLGNLKGVPAPWIKEFVKGSWGFRWRKFDS